MPSSRPLGALQDIRNNIELARTFVAGLSFADFQAYRKTVYAVIRCFEIISEASRRLPSDLKDRHPEIAWSDIAGAGSVYRHGYQYVRNDVLWRTVQESLKPLRLAVEAELNRLRT
jgi:uncharacterized protein with HEPN domain